MRGSERTAALALDRTLPRSSCLARCSSCGGAVLPRRYVSRWGEGGRAPLPVMRNGPPRTWAPQPTMPRPAMEVTAACSARSSLTAPSAAAFSAPGLLLPARLSGVCIHPACAGRAWRIRRRHPPLRCQAPSARPRPARLDPVFRADSVVLAISAEKDGNLRVVYARIGRRQGRPAWRGAQAAVPRRYVLHQVKRGASITIGTWKIRPRERGLHYSRSAPAARHRVPRCRAGASARQGRSFVEERHDPRSLGGFKRD